MNGRDDDRLEALYRRYGAVIYWRCRDILRDNAAAEDAAQETFMRVQRHLAKAPNGNQALRWIWRIATNHCLNELRNRKRRPEPREVISERPISGVSIEDALGNRQLFELVIARVGEKLRAVAWLHYVDGIEPDEAGLLLGVTPRTVTNRLAQFHKNARKIIARLS